MLLEKVVFITQVDSNMIFYYLFFWRNEKEGQVRKQKQNQEAIYTPV
jgi:hypothetical protein